MVETSVLSHPTRVPMREVLGHFHLITQKKFCEACTQKVTRFLPGLYHKKPTYCPKCGSFHRHRLMIKFLCDELNAFSEYSRVLHIAPHPAMKDHFQKIKNWDYITSDLVNDDVDINMDVTDLLFKDETFDLIIHNHLLEHIKDDQAGFREFSRVLRPGGKMVFTIPFNADSESTEYYPETLNKTHDQFDPMDHIRFYGWDLL